MAETSKPNFPRPTLPGIDPGHAMTFAAPLALDGGRSVAPGTVAYATE